MDKEEVARHIVDSAVAIHTALGPGLLESVYQQCLMYELSLRGLDVRAEYPIPIQYKGIAFDCGYRADLLVSASSLTGRSHASRMESSV
jgi:GxxExxY protein